RRLGAAGRFSFGSSELMQELLGVTPGSVTPFAVINDTGHRVTVVLDRALMAHEILHFHPLTNTGIPFPGSCSRARTMLQEAQTAVADASIKDTTTQTFVKDVVEESKHQP